MKMSNSDFDSLKKYCCLAINEHGYNYWKTQYSNNGLSDKRLRWDMFWGACAAHRNETGEHLGDLYCKGLNDNHIDTALKRIIKELENE